MTALSCLLALPLLVLLDTAWVALFRARPVGRFEVLLAGESLVRVRSSAGDFTIYPKARRLTLHGGPHRGDVPFSDIKGLSFRVEERHALLEELFFGFDLTDHFAAYQDTVDWHSIAVVTHDGRRIALVLSGQWHPREFLMGWYIDAQAWCLERLGLLTDVEAQCQAALARLRSALGDPPLV